MWPIILWICSVLSSILEGIGYWCFQKIEDNQLTKYYKTLQNVDCAVPFIASKSTCHKVFQAVKQGRSQNHNINVYIRRNDKNQRIVRIVGNVLDMVVFNQCLQDVIQQNEKSIHTNNL